MGETNTNLSGGGGPTDFQSAKVRINGKLAELKTELKAMHEQDVHLLRQLMNIHFTISALGGGQSRRSDSYSSLYTPSGAATPVSGTESPLPPFKRTLLQQPLQRMLSAPNSRLMKHGSIDSNNSSACEDEEDEPLGWSYNSTASDCGPLAWSLDMEHLETHLSTVLSPVPAAFRRLRTHPENQLPAELTKQSSSLAVMVRKPDHRPEFKVEHVTSDETGSLVMPVSSLRGSIGHTDFLSFVVDNSILKDEELEDDVIKEENDPVSPVDVKKHTTNETSIVSFKVNSDFHIDNKENEVTNNENLSKKLKPTSIEKEKVSFTVNNKYEEPLQSPKSPISSVSLQLKGQEHLWEKKFFSDTSNNSSSLNKINDEDSFGPKSNNLLNNNYKKDNMNGNTGKVYTPIPVAHITTPNRGTDGPTVPKWVAPRPFVRGFSPETQEQDAMKNGSPKQLSVSCSVDEPYPRERTLSPSPPPAVKPTHKRSLSGNVGRLLSMFQPKDSSSNVDSNTVPRMKRLSSGDRSMSTQDISSFSNLSHVDSSSSIEELHSRLGGNQLSASISNLASAALTSPSDDFTATTHHHHQQQPAVTLPSHIKGAPPPLKPKSFLTKQASADQIPAVYGSNIAGDNPIARKNRAMMFGNVFEPIRSPEEVQSRSQFPRKGTPIKVTVCTPSKGLSRFEIPIRTPTTDSNTNTSSVAPVLPLNNKCNVTKAEEAIYHLKSPSREIVINPHKASSSSNNTNTNSVQSSDADLSKRYEIVYDKMMTQKYQHMGERENEQKVKNGQKGDKQKSTVQLFL